MLNIKTQKVIDLQEWDHLVESTYGRPYSFQQQDNCKERQKVEIEVPSDPWDYPNDTVPEIVNHPDRGVSFKSWLERDPNQKIPSENSYDGTKLWWLRNFYPSVESVINDLYAKGLLEAGEYVIDIDW